ncbi:PREDICTED: RING-H2 finger protein ATL39-like [Tarenaya hassleriana]|uniref:RING-H2 finger protein ATL39-like n=1 Tax=Tarenaya hassleriana TaxID=28532 RepID=UPI00053C94E5|nr:PREDICTED: RING-H2 finger protein ATL39-like [Tarenaya hassleriana]
MECQTKIDVALDAKELHASSGLHSVFVYVQSEIEESVKYPDGRENKIGIYPNSSTQFVKFDLRSSDSGDIYQLLCDDLRDPPMCEYLAPQIADSVAEMSSSCESFFVFVEVKLTEERTFSVSESDVCCICLERFGDSGKYLSDLPCSHVFHRLCLDQWLVRRNSCPLCRRPCV